MSEQTQTATISIDPAVTDSIYSEAADGTEDDLFEAAEVAFTKVLHHVDAYDISIGGDENSVTVTWTSELDSSECAERTLPLLQQGWRVNEAALLMEILLGIDSDNGILLANLGMVYSDAGFVERAIDLLLQSVEIMPEYADGYVALGVAYTRLDDLIKAGESLRKAIEIEPKNPWAYRNLGVVYLRQDNPTEAITVLSKATELSPQDDRAWFGLAEALELTGDTSRADDAYQQAISINEYGDMAEAARQARSKIATGMFRGKNDLRMDAVMYLLSALEKFRAKDNEELQKIGFEIAMLGTTGININDPESSYTISSLPGEYSGLSLVCHQYAAFKQFAPQMDIGFDLSQEYKAAEELFHQRSKDA
jgi:tetratricopeptide (TPR) repeat protein